MTIKMKGDGQVAGVATVLKELDWLGSVNMGQRHDGQIIITALSQNKSVTNVAFVDPDGEVRWAGPPDQEEDDHADTA